MFEQDYIMRLIKEMVRAVLRLIFKSDIDLPTEELVEDTEKRSMLENLLDMIDNGEINEAENKLYSVLDGEDRQDLEVALLFYSHLNEKDDDFLKEHDYSREEIRTGLMDAAAKYGLGSVAETFLSEDEQP